MRMQGADFEALCSDIQINGLREPIVLHDGMILDGENRYRACQQVGVKPTFRTFDGGSIVAFVLSVNLRRRHMTTGQQSAIVASAQDWAKAQLRRSAIQLSRPKSATLHHWTRPPAEPTKQARFSARTRVLHGTARVSVEEAHHLRGKALMTCLRACSTRRTSRMTNVVAAPA